MEEARFMPEKEEVRLYVNKKDFPKFTADTKLGQAGEVKIMGKVNRESKEDKRVSKSIEVYTLDGESISKETEEDDKKDEPILVSSNPSFSVPRSSDDEFKDFHYDDKVSLTSNYEIVLVSDDSISLN